MTVVVIKGDDEALVAQALLKKVNELVGDGEKSLMTEELTEADYLRTGSEADVGLLVNAIQTPPFLTERRVIVGRNLALFSKAAQVKPLAAALVELMDGIDVVMVWEKGSTSTRLAAVPKPLTEALKSVGAETINAAPSGRGRKMLLEERLGSAPVRLDAAAKRLITNRVGDDVGRVDAILDTLLSTFGNNATLRAEDVSPFLGAASDVPPWDLTDAIDGGDIPLALQMLSRMTVGGERHGLQILATLHNHYQRALALDGSGVADEKAAASLLGMKGSTFPAKKALQLSRRLGGQRLAEIIGLLGQADLDLRGATAVPSQGTLDVLVARLARISR